MTTVARSWRSGFTHIEVGLALAPRFHRPRGRPAGGGFNPKAVQTYFTGDRKRSPLQRKILKALVGYRFGRTTRSVAEEIDAKTGHVLGIMATLCCEGRVCFAAYDEEDRRPVVKWKLREPKIGDKT